MVFSLRFCARVLRSGRTIIAPHLSLPLLTAIGASLRVSLRVGPPAGMTSAARRTREPSGAFHLTLTTASKVSCDEKGIRIYAAGLGRQTRDPRRFYRRRRPGRHPLTRVGKQ